MAQQTRRTLNGRLKLNITLRKSERDELLAVLREARESAEAEKLLTIGQLHYVNAARRIERALR